VIFELKTSKDGQPCVVMYETENKHKVIAKLSPSPDGRQIRLWLREFTSLSQPLLDVDKNMIVFDRDVTPPPRRER
jgi:hypothetical protein